MNYLYKALWVLRGYVYRFVFLRVGKMSYLGKPIFIYNPRGVTIGDNVGIFPGSRFECHSEGRITIESGVTIGQSFHITSKSSELLIEKGVIISGNVCITNIDHEYEDVSLSIRHQPLKVSNTIIGENTFLGYGSVIQAGTKLGKHCIVGANSTVKGNFPDYSVIVGSPGRVVKRYCEERGIWVRVDK
ncbi:TPA: DapH/DapD/GlmU-related protein [Vibrio parahaemolyticus]|uniref:Putative acetyltransferase n=1 Tax=Vibrio parahaemolyticus TaxID=670 RepID=A0A7M1WFJ2_VIBPH|nr:acyltransferase [Vibrio parahaemolyticus]QOS25877.1 putative acetyltransferase [Vibrio parahaemolyticus]TOM97331.1 lipopolysaccharide biosynthesis protein [Vibrio parahaemolyticus]HCH4060368.1 acyltransferase [Vibrio parahaemolyticus]